MGVPAYAQEEIRYNNNHRRLDGNRSKHIIKSLNYFFKMGVEYIEACTQAFRLPQSTTLTSYFYRSPANDASCEENFDFDANSSHFTL